MAFSAVFVWACMSIPYRLVGLVGTGKTARCSHFGKLGWFQPCARHVLLSKPGESAETFHSSSGDLPYPSIRNLPLLGVKYADYYRHAKIQETVYELLTEQYELAKVQEAKETPSVKVLDPGTVPEKKAFPPRLLIMFLGTFLAGSFCVVWVLGADHWNQADPQDPRKMLAQEVAATLKARTPWASRRARCRTTTVLPDPEVP